MIDRMRAGIIWIILVNGLISRRRVCHGFSSILSKRFNIYHPSSGRLGQRIKIGDGKPFMNRDPFQLQLSNDPNNVEMDKQRGAAVNDKVKALQEQARRARLEAEKMDISLTMEKINNLEKKLESDNLSDDESVSVQQQIEQLMNKLNPTEEIVSTPAVVSTKESTFVSAVNDIESSKETLSYKDEQDIREAVKSWKSLSSIEVRVRKMFLVGDDIDIAENDIEVYIRDIWSRDERARKALRLVNSVAWDLAEVKLEDRDRLTSMDSEELKKEYSNSLDIFYKIIELEEAKTRDAVTDEMAEGVLESIFSGAMKDELRRKGVKEEDIGEITYD